MLPLESFSIVPYIAGAPDLGAYELRQPATHYGPRNNELSYRM